MGPRKARRFEPINEEETDDCPARFGVIQLTMEPNRYTVQVAEACDRAGFDTFWLGEAYPWWRKHDYEARSLTSIAALIAHRTNRITILWGIVSPYTRHPIQIARGSQALTRSKITWGYPCSSSSTWPMAKPKLAFELLGSP